jgi:hypothetical protein
MKWNLSIIFFAFFITTHKWTNLIARIRAIEEEKKLQEREKRFQIRNERRNAIKKRFLKKMNEYNIDWTNDRRAIKWKVLDQKDNLFKKRESIQRRKEVIII